MTGIFTAGDYAYILAKYGQAGRWGSHIWYIGALDGSHSVPSNIGGNDLSHYSLYNADQFDVPDGGTTAALLGLSMVGLGMIRRRFNL